MRKNSLSAGLAISLVSILLHGSVVFSVQDQENRSQSKSNYAVLDDTIGKSVENGEVVGVELLVIEKNKTVIHEAYGFKDKEAGKRLEKGSIWTVMSMAKPFTATAILMLVEDGLLSLNDPVTKFIPNFAGDKRVTIHHLLAQSSGDDGKHGNGGQNVVEFPVLKDWVNDWAKEKPTGTFGEFAYSNFNYGALAYIVEKVSGMTIEEFIVKRIIKPLNLKQTYVRFSTDSRWAKKVASRYRWNEGAKVFEKTWSNKEPQSWKFYPGSLGLWMSAKDYAAFLQFWINKGRHGNIQLLKQSTVEKATTIQVNAYGEEKFGHGYGWFIDEEPLIFRYGGSAGGVGIAHPAENTAVVYLSHSDGGNHKTRFQDMLDEIWFPQDQNEN